MTEGLSVLRFLQERSSPNLPLWCNNKSMRVPLPQHQLAPGGLGVRAVLGVPAKKEITRFHRRLIAENETNAASNYTWPYSKSTKSPTIHTSRQVVSLPRTDFFSFARAATIFPFLLCNNKAVMNRTVFSEPTVSQNVIGLLNGALEKCQAMNPLLCFRWVNIRESVMSKRKGTLASWGQDETHASIQWGHTGDKSWSATVRHTWR